MILFGYTSRSSLNRQDVSSQGAMIDQANIAESAESSTSPRSLPRLSDQFLDNALPRLDDPLSEEKVDEENDLLLSDYHDVFLELAASSADDMACFTLTDAGLPTAFSLEELSPEECRDLSAVCFPVNGRSKSFGNSVSKAFNEAVSKLEMGHDSRNKQFHKLFPCVPDTESVINTYSCALVKDILLQGRMFVSENWICFHSNIFTYEKQIAIKVETITKITKEKTAFVVPNAIGVQTPSEKHIFGSLLSRHSTHQLLYRVWKNAKGETESMSPGSSLQGDSDEDDIPGESEDDDESDIEQHDGPNGRVLPPVSVHEYQKMDSSRLSDSFVGSHTGQGSQRQPHLPSDQSHSIGELQGHRSHVGYHHQISQMLCSVSIFKSIMRVGSSLKQLPQYQPFLLLIGILLLCLTFSAAVLTIRIWRLQPHMSTPSQTSAHESVHLESMDNIGDLFLSEQQKHQEKVSHIQDTLSANLKALLQVQSSLQHLKQKSENTVSSTQPDERSPDKRTKEDL